MFFQLDVPFSEDSSKNTGSNEMLLKGNFRVLHPWRKLSERACTLHGLTTGGSFGRFIIIGAIITSIMAAYAALGVAGMTIPRDTTMIMS